MSSKTLTAALLMAVSAVLPLQNTFANENILTFANYRDIRDLNPHLYGGEIFAQNLIFEGLIHLGENGVLEPWLATSWTTSKEGKVYTFTLRDDVTFSDGTPFDAHVVKANFDSLLDNANRHTWLESIRLMVEVENSGKQSVRVLDSHTVEVEFAQSYYPFLVELGVTRPFRFLSPKCFKEGTTKNGTLCYVGTGSYVLTDNVIDQRAIFERNDHYWGEKPQIEKIVAKVIPDNQSRLLSLRNGEIDMVYGLQLVSAQAYQQFEKDKRFATALSEPVSTRMLILNSKSENLNDTRVRQALSHLTNKAIIADRIMLGLEKPADTLLAKNVPYANIELAPYHYDVALAEKLLDEAGWKKEGQIRQLNGKPFEITLSYDSDKVVERTIAQYLQSEWSKVGLKMNLVGEEEQAHRDRLKQGDFDLSFNISWGTPYDPQSFLGGMRKPVYGDYAAQQGMPEKAAIDNHILAALEAIDEAERQAHYTYVLKTLHEQAIYIPITYEQNRAIFNRRVQHVGFNPSQFEIPFQRMSVR
ncbi:putative ABC-type dipeptide transport system, periplasmic component [Vibrio cincinnatiensis]|uniref:Nickel transport system substrate-binding protein n=1 Tax=Vibrio cincinnatiensis DSM 19608 TaxID=1123491 RepID=A0A1T4L4Z6_VIBCI|nr:nickel ABC transporter substrate-binding protein [Vibrio cincinnatiensis]SJZ49698.1 nickel transport system substrate-binding protein [Vibrio cincinnatiensis DSM 19608]SUP48217.1 putative ABC-type dipeptide transport system, periplasmic component [Vibrio cincinnatiensis]